MALRQRKEVRPFSPSLTIYDFLPVYFFRDSDGRRDLFFNWPLLLAAFAGFLVARL